MEQIKNLYKIEFEHFAPKGSKAGIETLILAKTNEEVYEYLVDKEEIYPEDHEDNEYEDDNGNSETFKERMLRLGGLLYDKDYNSGDGYYGITLIGWSLVKENIKTDYTELIELGLMVDLTNN